MKTPVSRNNKFLRRQVFARRKAIGRVAASPSPFANTLSTSALADKLRRLGLPDNAVSRVIAQISLFTKSHNGQLKQSTWDAVIRLAKSATDQNNFTNLASAINEIFTKQAGE